MHRQIFPNPGRFSLTSNFTDHLCLQNPHISPHHHQNFAPNKTNSPALTLPRNPPTSCVSQFSVLVRRRYLTNWLRYNSSLSHIPIQLAVMVKHTGLIPAPRGRIRTPVGHRYLEALQAKANGSSTTSHLSSTTTEKTAGLNLLILGVCSGTATDSIDFALCRFTQSTPEAPLHLEIVQVPLPV